MFRTPFIALGFALTLGLAGCAPPSEEPKAEDEAALIDEEAAPAETAATEPAPAPAPRPRPAEPAPPPPPAVCNECGVVASIEPIKEKGSGTGAGAVIGAIAGGVIGHQFGSGRGNAAATAAGAVIGAGIGQRVANQHQQVEPRTQRVGYEEVCETRVDHRTEQRIEAYDVSYRYGGRIYNTTMPYDPGSRIPVDVNVRPVRY